jgi:hypothetical protein
VPKLAITAVVLVIFGGAMLGLIGDFTKEIFRPNRADRPLRASRDPDELRLWRA